MTAETSYNMTCGTSPAVTCNTTSTHCKNGDTWGGELDSYRFVKNCTQLLRLECYIYGVMVITEVCCLDGIKRTTRNNTNELKGE